MINYKQETVRDSYTNLKAGFECVTVGSLETSDT